jgi:glyoxylase-like metal-dependent hydrolase (beta-lactamase superfamily II)
MAEREELSGEALAALIERVFRPRASDHGAAVLVDLPDRVRADAPWLVFTGDTLFVGDVGRPDLHGEGNTETFARQLHESVFGKLMTLDDSVEVYPSHFAGSACGRSMSGKPSSTIGFERRFNPALQYHDPDAFVAFVQKDQTPAPDKFQVIRQANLEGRLGVTA